MELPRCTLHLKGSGFPNSCSTIRQDVWESMAPNVLAKEGFRFTQSYNKHCNPPLVKFIHCLSWGEVSLTYYSPERTWKY